MRARRQVTSGVFLDPDTARVTEEGLPRSAERQEIRERQGCGRGLFARLYRIAEVREIARRALTLAKVAISSSVIPSAKYSCSGSRDRFSRGTDAIIFHQRVINLEPTGYIREQEILAAAMAHEIGHLLRGPTAIPERESCAPSGIGMSWSSPDWDVCSSRRKSQHSSEARYSCARVRLLPVISKLNGARPTLSSAGDGRESELSSAVEITDSGLRAMAGCS